MYSGTVCNLVLYFTSLIHVLLYFHKFKNKKVRIPIMLDEVPPQWPLLTSWVGPSTWESTGVRDTVQPAMGGQVMG